LNFVTFGIGNVEILNHNEPKVKRKRQNKYTKILKKRTEQRFKYKKVTAFDLNSSERQHTKILKSGRNKGLNIKRLTAFDINSNGRIDIKYEKSERSAAYGTQKGKSARPTKKQSEIKDIWNKFSDTATV
jgi:hypothetical protein